MAKKVTGGGIQGNKNVRPKVKYAPRTTNVVSPAGVSQLGESTDPKAVEPVFKGKRPDFAPMGNELCLNVGKGGPGTGRTVYRSGFQGLHSRPVQGEPVAQNDVPAVKPGRDVLREYGPERSNKLGAPSAPKSNYNYKTEE